VLRRLRRQARELRAQLRSPAKQCGVVQFAEVGRILVDLHGEPRVIVAANWTAQPRRAADTWRGVSQECRRGFGTGSTKAIPSETFRTLCDVLRLWQPLLVPGLLQTADYARAIYDTWRAVDESGDLDADVAARLARQEILDRPAPPSFGVLIDESVLHRCIGTPKVMHDQLIHIAEMSERPRVTVQILPMRSYSASTQSFVR
jgi:hypothetical protein